METPAPVEPVDPKGRRRRGPGGTDYLLCVRVGDMPKPLPLAVLEAKKETDDPLKGMQQSTALATLKPLRQAIEAKCTDIHLLPRKILSQAFGDIQP